MAQVYTKLINALAKDASQGTAESQAMLPDLMRELKPLLAIIGAIAPASADATKSTSGSVATWYSASNRFLVRDTACDGNPVYVNWQWGSSTSNPNRIQYSPGCGNSQYFGLTPPSGTTLITFRTCVDKQDAPDACSSWVTTRA